MSLMTDATWPWSIPGLGWPALLVVMIVLVGLTVWTYLGVQGASIQRVLIILGLRLLALVMALLAILRPSLAFQEDLRTPSVLLIACDDSESMTIRDEFNDQTRWDRLLGTLSQAEAELQHLREENNVTVVFQRFSAEVSDFDPANPGPAAGKRSDYGLMLHTLLERYRGERHLRGLVVLGDGTDNGVRHPVSPLASQWRNLGCSVHTFGFGKPTTSDRQTDIALTQIVTEPEPVPVKGKLTVRATVDAPGFENREVQVRVLLDDKPVPILQEDRELSFQNEVLRLTKENEIKVVCNAPESAGEVKVTLKIEPLREETTTFNNEISTFATVAKEGVRVLLVRKLHYESAFLAGALASDPRIRVDQVIFRSDRAEQGQRDLFKLGERHYDVIIIGDVTPAQMASGGNNVFAAIEEMVRTRGTGLLMMGGYNTFGQAWRNVPEMAALMPVTMDSSGAIEGRVRLELTESGMAHFVLGLADDREANAQLWRNRLTLRGMSRLGSLRKDVPVELLVRSDENQPVLVSRNHGSGRVMAFAGDTTTQWMKPEMPRAHLRFWQQMALWLAKQEDASGNVWVKPDVRRLPASGRLDFKTGVRGKGGVELNKARFEARVIDPDGTETPVATVREQEENRGTFWKTEVPGIYQLVVRGTATDSDGQTVQGEASARFLVYQNETEMVRRAAVHEFLKRLAAGSGGKFHLGGEEEFTRLLGELSRQPLAIARPRGRVWPNWQQNQLTGFLPGMIAFFVVVVSLEWFLRRRWGLV